MKPRCIETCRLSCYLPPCHAGSPSYRLQKDRCWGLHCAAARFRGPHRSSTNGGREKQHLLPGNSLAGSGMGDQGQGGANRGLSGTLKYTTGDDASADVSHLGVCLLHTSVEECIDPVSASMQTDSPLVSRFPAWPSHGCRVPPDKPLLISPTPTAHSFYSPCSSPRPFPFPPHTALRP